MDFGSCVSRVLNMLWLLHLLAHRLHGLSAQTEYGMLHTQIQVLDYLSQMKNFIKLWDEITEQVLTQKSAPRVEVNE